MNEIRKKHFIDKSNLVHNYKYDYSKVFYINNRIKVQIICPIHGVFEQTPKLHISGCGCKKCNFNYRKSIDQFIHESVKLHGNKYDYSKVNYISNKDKVQIICPIHGSFMQTPHDHLYGHGCSSCVGLKKITTSQFIKECEKIHDGKYDYSMVEYKNAYTKVKIICPIHGIFEQKPYKHKQNQGCPNCRLSKGENYIKKILQENNIKFETQKKFEDCINKKHLPFDFYLPDYKMCIEYDGEHHFIPINNWGGNKKLLKNQNRDDIKTNYCLLNNINLLRIKYDDDINIKLKPFTK